MRELSGVEEAERVSAHEQRENRMVILDEIVKKKMSPDEISTQREQFCRKCF